MTVNLEHDRVYWNGETKATEILVQTLLCTRTRGTHTRPIALRRPLVVDCLSRADSTQWQVVATTRWVVAATASVRRWKTTACSSSSSSSSLFTTINPRHCSPLTSDQNTQTTDTFLSLRLRDNTLCWIQNNSKSSSRHCTFYGQTRVTRK